MGIQGGVPSSRIPTYANYAALPASAKDGAVAVTLDTDTLWVFDAGSSTWVSASPAQKYYALVYQPGGTTSGNVYATWAALYSDLSTIYGPKVVEIDDSITSPAVIPAGTYDLSDTVICGKQDKQTTYLNLADGCVFTAWAGARNSILIQSLSTSPILTITTGWNVFLLNTIATIYSSTSAPVISIASPALLGIGLWQYSTLGAKAVEVDAGANAQILVDNLSQIVTDSLSGAGGALIQYDSTSSVSDIQSGFTGSLSKFKSSESEKTNYSPTTATDWESPVPTNVKKALDDLAARVPGNIFWVKSTESKKIVDVQEDIITNPLILDGTLQIDGRLTILDLGSANTENIRYVAKNGSDGGGNGSIDHPWLTIQHAINQITDALPTKQYVIYVFPGKYEETTISVRPNIQIIGHEVGGIYNENSNTILATDTFAFDPSWNNTDKNTLGLKGIAIIPPGGNTSFDFSATTAKLGAIFLENVWVSGGTNFTGYNDGIQAGNYFVCKNCSFLETVAFTCGGMFLISCFISNNLAVTSCPTVNTFVSAFSSTIANQNGVTANSGETATLQMFSSPSGSLNLNAVGTLSFAGTVDSFPAIGSIMITGTPTIVRASDAFGLGYTATTAGDWAVVPLTAQQALDYLAGTGIDKSQSANRFFASPDGSAGVPTFRAIATADLPDTAVTPGSYTNASLTVDAKGRLTAASSGTAPVTNVTATAPVVSSGGATPDISMAAATDSVDGYLTATDHTTFAAKVSPSRAINTTAPLTGGGDLSADRTIAIPAAGAATDGYLSSGTQTIGGSKTFKADTLIANDAASIATLGNASSTAKHVINGGLRVTSRTITANLTVDTTTTDNVILCNHSGAITVTLPAHLAGRRLTIKDISGAAATNNITLARAGGTGKIEGLSASFIIQSDYGCKTLFDDGTDWWFING